MCSHTVALEKRKIPIHHNTGPTHTGNFEKNQTEYQVSQGRVKVTDLISRINEEKKIEKKRNLALGVAAVSAVTVFGIILTI